MSERRPRHWRHRVTKRALQLFAEGANCNEVVVRAFTEEYGLDPTLYRLGTGLGAGIGARRDVCGLLTGCVMVLGMLNERGEPADVAAKRAVYGPAGSMYDWFAGQGQVRCTDIVRQEPFAGHTRACMRLLVGALAQLEKLVPPPEEQP